MDEGTFIQKSLPRNLKIYIYSYIYAEKMVLN